MRKIILTLNDAKDKRSIALLKKGEKVTVPLLRQRILALDLKDSLVLSTDSAISKLFKADYDFNDHGIYFDVVNNADVDPTIHAIMVKVKKLRLKLQKYFKQATEDELLALLASIPVEPYCKVVFWEKYTSKRDLERFEKFESFVDRIPSYKRIPFNPDPFKMEVLLDIETTGLNLEKDSITMIGVKERGSRYYSLWNNPTSDDIRTLLGQLERKVVVGHNLIFDLSFLMHKAGMTFAPNFETIDTMLLAHVSGERKLSLKHLSMMYGDFLGRRNTMTADEYYLVEDLAATEVVYNKFNPAYNVFAGKLVCAATKTFAEVKCAGTHISFDRLFELRDEYAQYATSPYDFNVNSNEALANYFVSKGVPLTTKTNAGNLKVDQKTLDYYRSYPEVQQYLDWNGEMNIYQKFIKPYTQLDSPILRPDILLFGTETGRLSCNKPNLQQVPNKSNFKDIFVSRFGDDGYIGSIDLDQAELRVAALLSNDEKYAQALLSQDFHRLVASKCFGIPEKEVTKTQRFTAKSVNFGGVLYGGSAEGIAKRINVETELVAKVQEWYKVEFSTLTDWIEDVKELAVASGMIRTYLGRVRLLKDLRWDQKRRIGVNTAVQSVASDILEYIVVRTSSLMRQQQLRSKILFPVHDEIILDIHKQELEAVVACLKQAFKDVLKSPIGQLPLAKSLPISGVLECGKSWLYVKNEHFQPDYSVKISSLEN